MSRRSKLTYKWSYILTNKEEKEDKPADNNKIDKDKLLKLKSRIPDYFGLVIYDKAYKLKSP
jgi:hypothetical protein